MSTPSTPSAPHAPSPSTTSRPAVAGDDGGPSPPFPLQLEGPVIRGFGRGSKELGIPTANIPISGLDIAGHDDLDSGIYFGFASLPVDNTTAQRLDHARSYPMVMSIGWNPFYKNTKRSAEVHLLPTFTHDFYGAPLRLLICGFIRPERNYDSVDALVADIRTDITVTARSLERPAWQHYSDDPWLKAGSTVWTDSVESVDANTDDADTAGAGKSDTNKKVDASR